jgi:ATP-dependent DNA helicase RecG
MRRKQIFISSVQREFAHARDKLASFINNDPYWSQFFYAFIFENLPASRRSPSDIYLGEIDKCAIYLGIFGLRYGRLNENGISTTEQEFDYAIEIGRDPLIFIKNLTPKAHRAERMQALIRKASAHTYSTFRNTDHLCSEVQRSLLYWQQDQNRRTAP